MPHRMSEPKSRIALKVASRMLLEKAGGGACFANATRVAATQLSNYASLHDEHVEKHMPIDVVLDLELLAGDQGITRALAALQGYKLVLDGVADDATNADLIAAIPNLVREQSELISKIFESFADGKITPAEKLAMEKAINGLEVVICDLKKRLWAL